MQILLYMTVKRKTYSKSLENFKKLKNYIKKLNNKTDNYGKSKTNR